MFYNRLFIQRAKNGLLPILIEAGGTAQLLLRNCFGFLPCKLLIHDAVLEIIIATRQTSTGEAEKSSCLMPAKARFR